LLISYNLISKLINNYDIIIISVLIDYFKEDFMN